MATRQYTIPNGTGGCDAEFCLGVLSERTAPAPQAELMPTCSGHGYCMNEPPYAMDTSRCAHVNGAS